MSKKGSTTVTPVDPVATAQAQTQSNVETAKANQLINMVNATGPYGTVRYTADPEAPGGYQQITTLSPEQQALYSQTMGIANDQLGRVNTALSTPLDTSGLPDLVSSLSVSAGPITKSFDQGGELQYSYDPGGQIQTSVGGDLDAARQQAIDAAYSQARSRLDPYWQQQQSAMEAKLANQGIGINSAAYDNAVSQLGRMQNDAYNQAEWSAVGAGEDAANALFARELGQGQFVNSAQAQQYGQNQGLAAFNNATAGQDYNQNLGAATFANTAQQQEFGQGFQLASENAALANAARSQGLQEKAYLQNQPINQLGALMSGSQVSLPQGIGYTPTQQANTDVLGAYALNQQGQLANAQQAQAANSGLMSGLFSLGSAALMGSDRRIKTDIERIGTHAATGLALYRYRYLGQSKPRVGVMADEVRKVRPDLVVRRGGYDAVNYAALDLPLDMVA